MNLTPNQQLAVTKLLGNLQLIACAGSGKTEVVARRIVHLLTPGRPDSLVPANIVAFTFTEKAAAELKERTITRARQALGEVTGLAEMFVGTIHAFCLELLKSETPKYLKFEVLNEVQQGLFVDHHSNPVQEAIVWSLHDLGARICVVGDDDQTIYQWRGSDVDNILNFDKRYPGVDRVSIEENFRSSDGIVLTARPFIEQNTARLPKAMKPTGVQPYETGDIVALSFSTPAEEAQHVAATAQSLRGVGRRCWMRSQMKCRWIPMRWRD